MSKTLICVDLCVCQLEGADAGAPTFKEKTLQALWNLLQHARVHRWRLVHIHSSAGASLSGAIRGLEPRGDEPLFVRAPGQRDLLRFLDDFGAGEVFIVSFGWPAALLPLLYLTQELGLSASLIAEGLPDGAQQGRLSEQLLGATPLSVLPAAAAMRRGTNIIRLRPDRPFQG